MKAQWINMMTWQITRDGPAAVVLDTTGSFNLKWIYTCRWKHFLSSWLSASYEKDWMMWHISGGMKQWVYACVPGKKKSLKATDLPNVQYSWGNVCACVLVDSLVLADFCQTLLLTTLLKAPHFIASTQSSRETINTNSFFTPTKCSPR